MRLPPCRCLLSGCVGCSEKAVLVPCPRKVSTGLRWPRSTHRRSPGPLTIVFPATGGLSDAETAGTGSVVIRFSAWQPLVDLVRRVGPVTGTSAYREGMPPPAKAEDVWPSVGDAFDLIGDAGPTTGRRPSTVIDVRSPIRIAREGAIERGAIVAQLAGHGLPLDVERR